MHIKYLYYRLSFCFKLLFLFCFLQFNTSDIVSAQDKIKIIDGDSLEINGARVRLYGIDAPEYRQTCTKNNKDYPCGKNSKAFLKKLFKDAKGQIKCVIKGGDRKKRVLAVCYEGDVDLNAQMVKNGHAIAYRRYSRDYIDAEDMAKAGRAGIWQGNFIKPETYRRQNRR